VAPKNQAAKSWDFIHRYPTSGTAGFRTNSLRQGKHPRFKNLIQFKSHHQKKQISGTPEVHLHCIPGVEVAEKIRCTNQKQLKKNKGIKKLWSSTIINL